MQKYKATGDIFHIATLRKLGPNGFRVREFVLLLDGQKVPMNFTGDNCVTLDSFSRGQKVEVEFSLTGREWTNPKSGDTKFFGELKCWSLRLV